MSKVIKNILIIEVEEANLALSTEPYFLSLADSPDEALRRYEVLAEVLLAQLVGLKDCHVRFVVSPADGVDAVRFWLLEKLRGEVTVLTASSQIYQFFPEQQAPTFTLDFAVDEGDLGSFEKLARMDFYTLECGARWLNMAFLQCLRGTEVRGGDYLRVGYADGEISKQVEFPQLARIKNADQWTDALEGPLGGKIEKVYQKNNGVRSLL